MIFLSLGAGVQSTVMLMLAIRGEIERPDHVIFADTGFEPDVTYRHVNRCERQCEEAGIPFHRVQAKLNMREEFEAFEVDDKKHWNTRPPMFVESGQLCRQCTRDAKIMPIHRKQVELLGYSSKKGIPDGAAVTQIGISTDEARRAGQSPERWYERSYPLIDPLKMSRADCQAWWEREYPYISLRASACVICPYKTKKMWLDMKSKTPDDFERACEYDERIRAAYQRKKDQSPYLHRDCLPLREAIHDNGQMEMELDDAIYCSGGCGL